MMMTEMLGKDGEMLVAKPEVKEGKKEAALRLLLVEASRHALTSEVLHLLEDEKAFLHKAIFDTWGWCGRGCSGHRMLGSVVESEP